MRPAPTEFPPGGKEDASVVTSARCRWRNRSTPPPGTRSARRSARSRPGREGGSRGGRNPGTARAREAASSWGHRQEICHHGFEHLLVLVVDFEVLLQARSVEEERIADEKDPPSS